MNNEKRFGLLSEEDIQELYALPDFNDEERQLYFEFNNLELDIADKYDDPVIWIYCALQIGYFKAKLQFFKFGFDDVVEDANHIKEKYFPELHVVQFGCVSKYYINKQKKEISLAFEYKPWSIEYEPAVKSHVCELLKYYPKSQNALRQLLNYFSEENIVMPSYRKIQDIFTYAYSKEHDRLSKLIESIPNEVKTQLKSLVEKNDRINDLNTIRADQKDFQFTAVRIEIDKVKYIRDLYEFSKQFIPKLGLAKNAVRYYADLVEQYPPSRLRKLNKPTQQLCLICFIQYRFQQILDNIILSFMYHVRTVMEASKAHIKLAQIEHNAKMIVDFPKLAEFLDWFPERNKMLTHDEINNIAYGILPKEQFPLLAKHLAGSTFDKKSAKKEFYLSSTRLLSLYLRPVVMVTPFEYYKEDSKIMELINLIKTHYNMGKSPSSFKLYDDLGLTVPKNMIKYLKRNESDKSIDPYLFEFYVYEKIYHNIDRGKLICNDSVSYCDIENDLVSDDLVDNVEEISKKFNYPKLPIYCQSRLDEALLELHYAWMNTTENIKLGRNDGFKKFKKSRSGEIDWSLSYDASEKLDDSFFQPLPKVSVINVMMFVGTITNMWAELEHAKDRYIKRKKPSKISSIACVLSEAFGFSADKMCEMSDINVNELNSTREDFIRVDTLCCLNDIVNNYSHSLPIFSLWDLIDDKILADADGQKFATSESTIQSRYSKKYLGKGKGISLYSLVANNVAVNAKNIGLNEYEGHSLFDMVHSNKTDITINMVTGDNHSLNKLNFVALDAINVDYVPSIKDIKEATKSLYSVTPIENYSGIVVPRAQISVNRIKSQEREITRVLLSLIMQENTQTNIIRKLNSHDRYARLRAGLSEYNNIFNSTHILNLIDSKGLRKVLRTARNRTEAYHQLQRVIRSTYHGVFKGKKIVNNRTSAHAVRLVANCIIAYNSTILNSIYTKMLELNVSKELIEEFGRISPIAWTHILLTGKGVVA